MREAGEQIEVRRPMLMSAGCLYLPFPPFFWPVMIGLPLSWQSRPAAWRTALHAAVPVVTVSWGLRLLTLWLGR